MSDEESGRTPIAAGTVHPPDDPDVDMGGLSASERLGRDRPARG